MLGLSLSICVAMTVATAQPPQKLEPKLVKQPIPFSHKLHSKVGLGCAQCHSMLGNGAEVGLPTASTCMVCHNTIRAESPAIRLLNSYSKEGKAIPWVRLNTIPEFVYFSHRKHLEAKISCNDCHGAVRTEDTLAVEQKFTMKFCIACHMARKATTTCTGCHELQL